MKDADNFKEKYENAQAEIRTKELLREERIESNKLYAIKMIETIVFSLIGLICMAVVGALIKLVILS